MKPRFSNSDCTTGQDENSRANSNYPTAHCPADGLLLAGKQNLILPFIEIPAGVADAAQDTGSGGQITLQQ